MKKLIFTLIALISISSFSSCKDDNEDNTTNDFLVSPNINPELVYGSWESIGDGAYQNDKYTQFLPKSYLTLNKDGSFVCSGYLGNLSGNYMYKFYNIELYSKEYLYCKLIVGVKSDGTNLYIGTYNKKGDESGWYKFIRK